MARPLVLPHNKLFQPGCKLSSAQQTVDYSQKQPVARVNHFLKFLLKNKEVLLLKTMRTSLYLTLQASCLPLNLYSHSGAIKYKSSFLFNWFGTSIVPQLSGTHTHANKGRLVSTHTNTNPTKKFTRQSSQCSQWQKHRQKQILNPQQTMLHRSCSQMLRLSIAIC